MKTSKIIFSMLFIAGVLLSMTSNAQTRVTINAGVIAPPPFGYAPNNGYIYYGPQPYGGYYAPRGYYGPAHVYPHHSYYNHPHYGYGNRGGNHYGNRNGNRNHY